MIQSLVCNGELVVVIHIIFGIIIPENRVATIPRYVFYINPFIQIRLRGFIEIWNQ